LNELIEDERETNSNHEKRMQQLDDNQKKDQKQASSNLESEKDARIFAVQKLERKIQEIRSAVLVAVNGTA